MTITMTQPAHATKLEAAAAASKLHGFIGRSQMAAMANGARGEESQYFLDKFVEMAQLIETMPKTYDQDGMGGQAVAYLHYFTGAWDWFITEKDSNPDGEGQHQAFGLVRGFETELGYISIVEIIAAGAELDLHWMPKTLDAIRG